MKIYITSQKGKELLVDSFAQLPDVHLAKNMSADLIIPTVDEELPFFSQNKEFLGCPVMVSDPYTIDMCRDKAEFFRFCRRHSFDVPETAQGNFVVKPRFGKGSKQILKIDRSYILQELIDWPEYSIDYFADWKGKCLSIIPRIRQEIVDGASTKAKIEYPKLIVDTVERLGKELNLIGHNVVQGFYNGKQFLLSEVNPRFGGGSHLTFHIFNSPKWLIEHYEEFYPKRGNGPLPS